MTKKHFIELADTLAEIRRRIENHMGPSDETISIIEEELCRFCKHQNGQFNRERFLGYSRGENGPSGGDIKPARKLTQR